MSRNESHRPPARRAPGGVRGALARLAVAVLLAAGGATGAPTAEAADSGYGIAMHGTPALPPDFQHMPYANPDAPKGGRLVEGLPGTFDSLNPLIVKGIAVQQIRGYVIESLMARGSRANREYR